MTVAYVVSGSWQDDKWLVDFLELISVWQRPHENISTWCSYDQRIIFASKAATSPRFRTLNRLVVLSSQFDLLRNAIGNVVNSKQMPNFCTQQIIAALAVLGENTIEARKRRTVIITVNKVFLSFNFSRIKSFDYNLN